jgi:hypothetical protein
METVVPVPRTSDGDARKAVEYFTSRFKHKA